MPGKTPSQRIEELSKQIHELEFAFGQHQALVNHRLDQLEAGEAERRRAEEELKARVADLAAKNAALEERSRHQEKTSDRGWQLWLAALGFGFGLVSLLISVSIQFKK